MKKFLALCAGMMLLASAAMAQTNGLQLAWNNCANVAGSAPAAQFDCAPLDGSIYQLFGTFSLASPAANVIAVDNIIDNLFPDTPTSVPAFWQFQTGGCNNSGIALGNSKPVGLCGGGTVNTITLCGSGGSGCPASFITAYGVGVGGPNRGRLLMTLARSAAAPVTLGNTVRHFAFVLNFFMDNAPDGAGGGCDGCNASVGTTWNNAIFYNNAVGGSTDEATAVVLSSTDPGSTPSVGANCVSCVSVSGKSKTWGQLKSLYR